MMLVGRGGISYLPLSTNRRVGISCFGLFSRLHPKTYYAYHRVSGCVLFTVCCGLHASAWWGAYILCRSTACSTAVVVAHLSIHGVELVGNVPVVLPGHSLPDGRLHQTGERREHVDGGEDLLGVQLPIQVDLGKGTKKKGRAERKRKRQKRERGRKK